MSSIWSNRLKSCNGKLDFIQELTDVLGKMEVELTSKELDPESYYGYNWSYVQADINGQRRIIRQIRKMINLDQKGNIDNERKPIEQPT